jgi:fatty acid desaturase
MEQKLSSLEPKFYLHNNPRENQEETLGTIDAPSDNEKLNVLLGVGVFILWLIVFFVFFWIFYYSMAFSFLLIPGTEDIDTLKVFIVSLISAIVLVVIIYGIKMAYLSLKKKKKTN